jgi:hypothetical protein
MVIARIALGCYPHLYREAFSHYLPLNSAPRVESLDGRSLPSFLKSIYVGSSRSANIRSATASAQPLPLGDLWTDDRDIGKDRR